MDCTAITNAPLGALRNGLAATIPSSVGLSVRVVVDGQPVTLTAVDADLAPNAVAASLRLPLSWMDSMDDGSAITIYATVPGAFVDLAADLAFELPAEVNILLDRDLGPEPARTGLEGAEELSTINRAVGVLMGRGYGPREAWDTLQRQATATREDVHETAGRLLTSVATSGPLSAAHPFNKGDWPEPSPG
jgi:hypothetical protein